ncbi:MAG: hypothetical protein FWH53_00155 [Leptospirales bacterium]|nr:hypothetical protein [Leptospirales bacterium]
MEKNQIKDAITDIISGRDEASYYFELIHKMDELNDIELDQYLVENFGKLSEEGCASGLGDSWRSKIGWVVEGEYPLENLPDHVRDIAQRLYYDRKS